MIRSIVRAALAIAGVALASNVLAFSILQPSDPIIGIDLDITSRSNYPGGEPPSALFDANSGTKYLNFAQRNTGVIITPSTLSQLLSFRITTANDSPERDPAAWQIFGTNSPILSTDNSAGDAEPWTLIGSGALTLPTDRLTDGPLVTVPSGPAFSSYRVVFPAVRDLFSANSLQIADLGLYSTVDGTGANLGATANPVLAIHRPTSESAYPGAEGPATVLDNSPNTKYLNFGRENSGFIVTPGLGPTVVSSFQVTTANDAPERDPTSWKLWGTNQPITSQPNSDGSAENWTLIDEGTLTLPGDRFTLGPVVPVNNTAQYNSYRLVFPTITSAAANSMQYSEVQFFSDDPGQVRVTVNRATGEVRIEANEAVQIGSYELISNQFGALNEATWNSIATTGDSNSGGSADPNDVWEETSATNQLLSERDIPGAGSDNGFSLSAGQSRSLGNLWRATPFEDLQLTILDPSGAQVTRSIEFLGTPRVLGDYNGDGAVTSADWPAFRAGFGGDYSNTSPAAAYLGGDLDGDLDSDLTDFNLFVGLAGGQGALFGPVPEPGSLTVLALAFAGGVLLWGRRGLFSIATFFVALIQLGGTEAVAQTFTVAGGTPTATTPDPTEFPESGPQNFFDDTFLDDPGVIQSELFVLDYNDPDLMGGPFAQYQGLGGTPKTVFFDYGASVSANWFAYSQRSGDDPTADRAGKFEFWFSNASFNDVLPATAPDSSISVSPTDNRLFDSVLRPYTLGGTRSGRFVAMRITLSEASADQPTNNLGGHEFRLLNGPSDVVLEVNRANGNLTLRNNLAGSVAIDIKGYAIESPGAGLNAAGFNGVRGDSAAFPAGNGSGNGWELGGGSGSTRLAEAYFAGTSTLASGVSGLALGAGYNPLVNSEDLNFIWTNSAGNMFNGRVVYVGVAPSILTGDYNNNGVVDAADYTVWRDALGSTAVLPNDATPGTVTQADYVSWVNNFGATAAVSAVSAAVPEPAGLLAAATALAATGLAAGRLGGRGRILRQTGRD